MLRYIHLILLCSIFFSIEMKADPGGATLTGKITNQADSLPLVSAVIYFPDLKTGASTDINGQYKITNLPEGIFLAQISLLGFATITQKITLTANTVIDFQLVSSVTEMAGVVVTGQSSSSDPKRTPTPIIVISNQQLQQNAATNIIDAVAKLPGISQSGTGPGISKPVIRGLGFNRVVVVHDGIRQEGQQWGDEHGIEIDESSVSRIEILKGPASLSYGSDAMAGVINIMSAPTLPSGTITGNFSSNYQTNNGLAANSINFAGNLNGFIWDARYSNKFAHDYKNKYDGGVYNSRYSEENFGGMIGLNKSWGYSHLSFSAYHITPGIAEGERDSVTGRFIKEVRLNDSASTLDFVNDADLHSYKMTTPYQDIRHYKITSANCFIIGEGLLKTTIAFQQNRRKEFGDVFNPDEYGLFFLMNTINYDVRYTFPEKNHRQFSAGINGMQQTSLNEGIEFLVPEYSLFDVGGFVTARKSWKKLDVSGGIRYDIRVQKSNDLFLDSNGIKTENPDALSLHQFTAFRSTFSGVSGSVGFSYRVSEKVYTKLNISRGYRAPNIAELGANGEHEGTLRYEIGDPQLKPETSTQADLALGFDSEHFSGEIDLFGNDIQHFIFLGKVNSSNGADSIIDGMPVFKFISGHAQLFGGEATIDFHPHPLDFLHFENSFGFVIARQLNAADSTKYLPFTPAPVFRSELRANMSKQWKFLRNGYVKIEAENFFAQERIYSAMETETVTPGYFLLNAGAGTEIIRNGRIFCSLNFSVNNIADVAYQNHLSRLKYSGPNYATGRNGVYNMGRNFSVKLNIPLYLKKSES
ncbi:MAG: TonB-dependent receptor [Bacteroidota bacterium]|nr:TonB-dependent receptor [Bacteroidota bacterium]